MFSSVTARRLRYQLSSSVSIDTMRTPPLRIETSPECCRSIQRAEPPPTPTRAEDRDLLGHPPGLGPVPLVGVVTAQEIEAAVAALDGAPDHRPHEHQADALTVPPRIAATLVEVDGVAAGEPVPRGRRHTIEVERRQPQLPPCRQLRGETRVESPDGRVPERALPCFTGPATFMQCDEMVQPLVEAVAVIVRDRHRVVTLQVALFAPQRLAARGRQRGEIALPLVTQVKVGARPQSLAPHYVTVTAERLAQPARNPRVRRQVAEDDHLPGQKILQRRRERANLGPTSGEHIEVIRTPEIPHRPGERLHRNPVERDASRQYGKDGGHGAPPARVVEYQR